MKNFVASIKTFNYYSRYDFESNIIGNDFNKKILEFSKFLEDRQNFNAYKSFSTILPGLKKGNWHSSSPAKDEITFCAIARPVAFEIRQE